MDTVIAVEQVTCRGNEQGDCICGEDGQPLTGLMMTITISAQHVLYVPPADWKEPRQCKGCYDPDEA